MVGAAEGFRSLEINDNFELGRLVDELSASLAPSRIPVDVTMPPQLRGVLMKRLNEHGGGKNGGIVGWGDLAEVRPPDRARPGSVSSACGALT
jgi:hypothetical protein